MHLLINIYSKAEEGANTKYKESYSSQLTSVESKYIIYNFFISTEHTKQLHGGHD